MLNIWLPDYHSHISEEYYKNYVIFSNSLFILQLEKRTYFFSMPMVVKMKYIHSVFWTFMYMNLVKGQGVEKLCLNTCFKTKRPPQNSWPQIDLHQNFWPFYVNIMGWPKLFIKSTITSYLTDFSVEDLLNVVQGQKEQEFIWANFNMSEENSEHFDHSDMNSRSKTKKQTSCRNKLPKNEKKDAHSKIFTVCILVFLVLVIVK